VISGLSGNGFTWTSIVSEEGLSHPFESIHVIKDAMTIQESINKQLDFFILCKNFVFFNEPPSNPYNMQDK